MPKVSAVSPGGATAPHLDDDDSTFVFRPIHYLGSKLRVLAAIEQAIDSVDPSGGPVCDLFSGSATVARYLSKRRRVMAVDVQEYARVLAEAVLNGDADVSVKDVKDAIRGGRRGSALVQALDPLLSFENDAIQAAIGGDIEPLCEILELGSLASQGDSGDRKSKPRLADVISKAQNSIVKDGLFGSGTVCVRHFGGQYFSYAQAAALDTIAEYARERRSPVILAAALSTASHLVNSIGKQFAQPIKPRAKTGELKKHVINKIIQERSVSAEKVFYEYLTRYELLANTRRDHAALRMDFREALAKPIFKPSVVYADPPYTRDHYSRFYHTLETIAVGDDPLVSNSNLGGGHLSSRGGYRMDRHQSPFCIKSQAHAAFTALFAGVAALQVPLVLSYSGYDPNTEGRPRVMALDAVVSLARQHFRYVRVQQLAELDHMKLNTVALNKIGKGTTEVLLICTNS